MRNIADPVTQWAFIILVSVVMGTCLLIAVAIFRRWQQIRHTRYVHSLQRQYRPVVAKVLSGARSPSGIEALRELPLADVELLLDPLFSKRKLSERSLVFLQALCAELGLIELWQSRLANGRSAAIPFSGSRGHEGLPDRGNRRYLLRAKSIRNLGTLRHRPSWPLLVKALDDRHPDIQLVALRSLAALGAPESFPVLRDRLHAVVEGKTTSPPWQGLQAALVSFDLTCVPALLPSLRHPDRQIRLHGTEILRTMVCREAARQPGLALTPELLAPQMVELLLAGLAVDTSAEIRARAAEVVVFLADPRAASVLRDLLRDHQWFVRLHSVRALARLPEAAAPLHLNIRECLRDPHWRVREAAIQTLIALGQKGKQQLFEHFLTSADRTTREQIIEVMERAGLISALVEEYSAGANSTEALMVEQLASNAASLGLSGVLCASSPEILQKFLDRMLPCVEAKLRFLEKAHSEVESAISPPKALTLPPNLAA
jgi:HEAT repeat protein